MQCLVMVCSGILVAAFPIVKTITCEHCLLPTTGEVYRVKSEEGAGEIFNMIVCDACAREARKLGLKTEEIDAATRRLLEH
jgi:hypothetical protein